ncbi:transcriptional regulator [candidate division WOR-3 bacterium RBG_13_43_14]|uniref:Probable transcriptional regulatory protein A2Y85_07225 n=1 Tax=candidate division WOR-3 bacterium RBG_13_43_14 TaxID=1802590 RepID=A0A1F4UE15_UNCW3|nr:MAG: transcriptional regulator [candidate division WOR-3 bacterium RBG_13_43_14]
MSGHSKWSKIKRKKGSADTARGRVFTKLIKEITIAAKHGGDPKGNPRLRAAIEEAKAMNMPNDNIIRAIKRGTGELEGQTLEEVSYEAYGPCGIAILIDAVTDNRNRTTSEIRHVLSRHNGTLGNQGSVAWQFQSQGIINIDAAKYDEDTIIALALDGGATDVTKEEDTYVIIVSPDNFSNVKDILQSNQITIASSELTKVPQNTIPVSEKDAEKIIKLYEMLDEMEDVQHVYANFEIPDSVMEKLSSATG